MVKKFGNQDAEKNHFSKQMKFRKRSIKEFAPKMPLLIKILNRRQSLRIFLYENTTIKERNKTLK